MKLLYITFIDLKKSPSSGSSVRPHKMLEAFQNLNIDTFIVDGATNDLKTRKNSIKLVEKKLTNWKPDICYIEPPSGPMFYYGDVQLIKKLHRMGVPISIFYRDAYWKYPSFYLTSNTPIVERLKDIIIRNLHRYQLSVFKKNIDIIYFPSETMKNEFDCPRMEILPPGSFLSDAEEKKSISHPLQVIFVGGAAKNYGTFLTLDAFELANKNKTVAKLFYICPEEQWKALKIDKEKYSSWLEVIHTSGDKNLKPYYEKSDIAILTAPKTFYRDFAVPIKIFEYLSYLKPILATDCIETAKVINENQIGWVVKDNASDIASVLQKLNDNSEIGDSVKANMTLARDNNLWTKRAEKVVRELSEINKSKGIN